MTVKPGPISDFDLRAILELLLQRVTVRVGVGPPDDSLGKDGDVYIET